MTTVVLGGGYAGIMAANRLAARGAPVQLVTTRPWFVERIRLHTVASGARVDARVPLDELLDERVELTLGTAVRAGSDVLELESGGDVPFETLVLAVGSGASPAPDATWRSGGAWGSGAAMSPRAFRVTEEDDAARLRAELEARPDARVTVVGAGLTGIELAGALTAAGRSVRLVSAHEPRRAATKAHLAELARRGVTIETGVHLDVEHLEDTHDEVLVDATGLLVPPLAHESGLPTDEHGRLIVDETLSVPGHPRILGAGDAVLVRDPRARHLRAACATALPMGAHAADVILARADGQDPAPFDLGYLMQCVDLGNGRGHVQLVRPDDSERAIALTGRAGGLLKETVCRLTLRWMARAGRYSWPAGPAVAAAPALAR